ncbi:MAG: dTDP-3-amino-3,4,6-trideoxy-alpha-D-glucose transaminase [Candidatus Omnitrophica bacterium]|nr:dTDP-3-amino-3,4,6-trideoxy-alpha-D-glucose transaminase [Candidatus Omnitrophota bacterium]
MSLHVPFFDLKRQNAALRSRLDAAVAQVVDDTAFILGEEVARFEADFAAYVGTRYAVGVNSGLDALALSLRALGVGPGDEVIVPANTFIATALAVDSCGARAVFVDCDPRTLLMDLEAARRALTPRTKAVLPVHLYGHPLDLSPVREVLRERGVRVIEDACQAHGARIGDRSCGAMGEAGCFSFYPSKNLGAFGDGGMITTDDEKLRDRLRLLRSYGSVVKYRHETAGWNSRLDTVQAAVLRVKLPYLDGWNDRRRQLAARYRSALEGARGIELPVELPGARHVYHLYIVRCDRRDELKAHLESRGIGTGIHYPVPIHRQPAYAAAAGQSFPVAEAESARLLSLPMFPEMKDEEVDAVCDAVRAFAR